MFRKLRNRFLILNLVIISVMMFIAFASIYLITYKNVMSDIDMELHRISEFYLKPDKSKSDPRPGNRDIPDKPEGDIQGKPEGNIQPSPERSVSFFIITDNQWKIIDSSSNLILDNDFYESAKEEVLNQNRDKGSFKLDGNNWSYIKNTFSDTNKIVFLDTTSRQIILTNLIFTFLIVELVMLIFIYFISSFFASKYIKPVKEAFDKQNQFIADASHELKTPLAVINTNVDVLLSNGDETINNQIKWLHYIKSESERMTKLTNDLLYLTHMGYSDNNAIFTEFNLSEAVENVILTMEAIIFEHDISLNYEIEPDLKINGSSEQIKEVVMILMDNAIKYTNVRGSINIALKRQHNSLILAVTNTGDGIAEEHLEKIFDRFYRTDKSRARKMGGYGLGLAIAKTIINQHKGRIYARSVIKKDTTFFVELPVI